MHQSPLLWDWWFLGVHDSICFITESLSLTPCLARQDPWDMFAKLNKIHGAFAKIRWILWTILQDETTSYILPTLWIS